MPLTADQYQTLIIAEVGDDAAGTLAANMATLWTSNDTAASDYAHYLLTKRSAIDLLLGGARFQADFQALDTSSVKLDQLWQHLMDMRELVEDALAQLGASAGGGIAVGALTQTAPILACPWENDPNSRRLRGDPLRRSR